MAIDRSRILAIATAVALSGCGHDGSSPTGRPVAEASSSGASLPRDWPSDVPLPASSYTLDEVGQNDQFNLRTATPVASLFTEYASSMKAVGWQQTSQMQSQKNAALAFSRGDRNVRVSLRAYPVERFSEVDLEIEARPGGDLPMSDQVPAGVHLPLSPYTVIGSSQQTDIRLHADASTDTLFAQYETSMKAAGWHEVRQELDAQLKALDFNKGDRSVRVALRSAPARGGSMVALSIHLNKPDQPPPSMGIGTVDAPAIAGATTAPADVRQFLEAAKAAEAITDPMRRCLDYPDPPGSHWSRTAVFAYCSYRFQPILSAADFQDLIRKGQATDVDRRFADALKAPQSQQLQPPESRDLLDRTFYLLFRNGSPELRASLDAWKRQSPNSAFAFAFAASGTAYEAAAADARGDDAIDHIPDGDLATMDRLLKLAIADLDKAVALDARMTPAYSEMVKIAGMTGDSAYSANAAKRGLAADPSNYTLYARLLWASQPKWGGSLEAMRQLVEQAQAHAADNALLLLLKAQAAVYASNIDTEARTPAELASFGSAFDEVASAEMLSNAGIAARASEQFGLSAVCLSEALRFDPALGEARLHRINDLTGLDFGPWAVQEATALLAENPRDKRALDARGFAYMQMHDVDHAEQDFSASLALVPGDGWVLDQLARIYVKSKHDWNKGWALTEQLTRYHPQIADGWIMRASIQKDQPRPGLDDTMHYFLARFSDDPDSQQAVSQMRAQLGQPAQHP